MLRKRDSKRPSRFTGDGATLGAKPTAGTQ
jgi:hypothetical protein